MDGTAATTPTAPQTNGQAAPAQQAQATVDPSFQRPPVGAPGGPPIPPTIPLTVEEYQRLRGLEGQLAEYQRTQQAAMEAAEAARLKALADKGQVEEALEQQRKTWEQKHAEATTRYSQLEQQVFGERKEAVLSEAMNGRQWYGETPEQRAATAGMARRLLQDEFETVRDASGALVVREKASGRPAAEVIRERLDSPSFAVFLAPTTRGGSGVDASRPPAPQQSQSQPGSLEAIAAQFQAARGENPGMGLAPKAR